MVDFGGFGPSKPSTARQISFHEKHPIKHQEKVPEKSVGRESIKIQILIQKCRKVRLDVFVVVTSKIMQKK